jgi:hypothetical protein
MKKAIALLLAAAALACAGAYAVGVFDESAASQRAPTVPAPMASEEAGHGCPPAPRAACAPLEQQPLQ